MELTFCCHNHQCQELREKQYTLSLNIELVMDEKNIAHMFCPHCKKKLKREIK